MANRVWLEAKIYTGFSDIDITSGRFHKQPLRQNIDKWIQQQKRRNSWSWSPLQGYQTLHHPSFRLLHSQFIECLKDLAHHTAGNVTDVARYAEATGGLAEVAAVDTARVVLTKGRVDGWDIPLVTPVLQVLLEVLSSTVDHGRGLRLGWTR